MTSLSQQLLEFCRGDAPDAHGRYLREMWDWSDDRLEGTHNYIQWMFPLTEPSLAVPGSPFIAPDDAAAFSNDDGVQNNMNRSLERMLRFLGFESKRNDRLTVTKAATFAARAKTWLWRRNHNLLRITRILKSLNLCGLKEEAQAFFNCLNHLSDEERSIVGSESFSFWKEAAA